MGVCTSLVVGGSGRWTFGAWFSFSVGSGSRDGFLGEFESFEGERGD